jgi:hypothetical protein
MADADRDPSGPEKEPTEDEAGVRQSPGDASGVGAGSLQVEGVPVVSVRLPKPPDRLSDGGRRDGTAPKGDAGSRTGGTRPGRGKTATGLGSGLRIIDRFPSTLGRWIFGVRDEHGGLKLGLVSKRYPKRADELVLDSDDLDLLDEAFAGPFKKLLKLLGLSSEEMAMIVVGIIVMMPRIGVIVEEESEKAKQKKEANELGVAKTRAPAGA